MALLSRIFLVLCLDTNLRIKQITDRNRFLVPFQSRREVLTLCRPFVHLHPRTQLLLRNHTASSHAAGRTFPLPTFQESSSRYCYFHSLTYLTSEVHAIYCLLELVHPTPDSSTLQHHFTRASSQRPRTSSYTHLLTKANLFIESRQFITLQPATPKAFSSLTWWLESTRAHLRPRCSVPYTALNEVSSSFRHFITLTNLLFVLYFVQVAVQKRASWCSTSCLL